MEQVVLPHQTMLVHQRSVGCGSPFLAVVVGKPFRTLALANILPLFLWNGLKLQQLLPCAFCILCTTVRHRVAAESPSGAGHPGLLGGCIICRVVASGGVIWAYDTSIAVH